MTADKAALLDLRDRLKAATGPDRKLDAEITVVLRLHPIDSWTVIPHARGMKWWAEKDGRVGFGPAVSDGFYARDFSGSLDAAVGLVPEGAWKEITGPRKSINIPSPSPNFWHCEITTWDPMRISHGWGATEPLAIIDALLAHELAKVTDHA